MDNPLVSILIPAYNVEKYISQCLDSVVNQTYRNLQIVIVDDGSKDSTAKICDEYASKDNRIEVYHIPNGGVANARNVLLSKIKGDYFLFVDSDDWIEVDTVEFLIDKAVGQKADIVICGYTVVHDDFITSGSINTFYNYNEELYDKESLVLEFIKHNKIKGALWNKLIRSSLIGDNIVRTEISYGEDALLFWKFISNVNKVIYTDNPKYFYRMNNALSITRQEWTPEGKGSGKIVWDTIREDVIREYPQYTSLVNAKCAIMDMWSLLCASRANYPRDMHIKECQKFINTHVGDLSRNRWLSGTKQYLTALLLGRWYGAGKIINKFM